MSAVTCQISISLDGFVAGPNQSLDTPLGEGGERLHAWAFATAAWNALSGKDGGEHSADSEVFEQALAGNGAYIMGRNMFGPIRGEWDESWRGWWGEEPPYHVPTFVLTHHPRESLRMDGGTTFHFVTDGIEAALERARGASGGRDIAIAGGAHTVQQYLRAGLLDELYLHIVPVLLGSGERLLEDVRPRPHAREGRRVPGRDPREVPGRPLTDARRGYAVCRW